MWDCQCCGCMNILDVPFCPQCFVPKEVATKSGQAVEGSSGSPVGSQTEELKSSSPSEDNSTATSSSPKTKTKTDWGK